MRHLLMAGRGEGEVEKVCVQAAGRVGVLIARSTIRSNKLRPLMSHDERDKARPGVLITFHHSSDESHHHHHHYLHRHRAPPPPRRALQQVLYGRGWSTS